LRITLISSQQNEDNLFNYEESSSSGEVIICSSTLLKAKENGLIFAKVITIYKEKKYFNS